jgi:hypothetical protein
MIKTNYDKQYKTEAFIMLKNHISYFLRPKKNRRYIKENYLPMSASEYIKNKKNKKRERDEQDIFA